MIHVEGKWAWGIKPALPRCKHQENADKFNDDRTITMGVMKM
jgi:hypothetical protein